MKTITIREEDIQRPGFITPPENGGQIVTYSYACTEDYILERAYDASDRSEVVTAYAWPKSGGGFEPQNGTPTLGREIGPARIE